MTAFLITGGAGYIGSVLVPRLLAEKHHVTVIDSFYFGRETLPRHPRLTCIEQDSRAITSKQLEGIDVVVDLAAMSNDPCGETFEALTWDVNHRARVRTAKLAQQTGVTRYILPSSCSVYGFQDQLVDETSPTNPLTTYAKANLKAEQEILPLGTDSFCVTVLRLATVFGYSPKMRLDLVVNAMAYSAWKHGEIVVHGGGTQYRPLVHVKDVASAITCVAQASLTVINREIYNIGSSALNCQINTVAHEIKEVMSGQERTVQITHNSPQDLRSYHASFRKIQAACNWQSHYNIRNEVRHLTERLDRKSINIDKRCHTLDWYKSIFSCAALAREQSNRLCN